LDRLNQAEKAMFGDRTSSGPAWTYMKQDNYMVKTLKELTMLFAHNVEHEAKIMEKDVRKAKKIFYG